MIILGLHCGHDASIAVIRDGEVLICLERERINRRRHTPSLTADDVVLVLKDVGLTLDDVDYCTLTSSQWVDYIFYDRSRLRIDLDRHPKHTLPCTMTDLLAVTPSKMMATSSGTVADILRSDHPVRDYFTEASGAGLGPDDLFGGFEHFIDTPLWRRAVKLSEIAKTDYRPLMATDGVRHGFHYPATLHILDKAFPAYIFSHHYAHATYAFYSSPYERAAILTNDGGHGGYYVCGLMAYGDGHRVFPLTPNHLTIGQFYEATGFKLGLGVMTGAGKLMGLAAYGKPVFFDTRFVGNHYDIAEIGPDVWIDHCLTRARALGYDLRALADPNRMTDPINADIAASTQKLTEEILYQAALSLKQSLQASKLDGDDLCFSGGVALNCPANRILAKNAPFRTLFVPPAVHDGGLAIGSALGLYHNVLDQPRRRAARSSPSHAYLGLKSSATGDAIARAISHFESAVDVNKVDDSAQAAAEMLKENRVIGWFEGRSEIGPRALGHRSILGHPGHLDNWRRLNVIKQRELWRPLAPAVLAEDADAYFESLPQPSYYMLFNVMMRSSALPAVTHVDGSARVQLVTEDCGAFYRLLKAFKALTGVPVVLNTSFNDRGEPIVETPEDAIKCFLNIGLDALFFEGHKLTRRVQ